MTGNLQLLAPIFIPIVCGLAFLFMKNSCKTKSLRLAFVLATFVSAFYAVLNCFNGESELLLWNLTETMPIKFKLDQVGVFFSSLTSLIWCVVAVYTVKYINHEERENQYFGFYLITYGVIIALDYSATLITMYLFYELMTMVTLGLVVHSRTKEAISATIRYLLYSLFGAFMGLMCIFFVAGNSTSLDFTLGGVLQLETVSKDLMLVLALVGIMGFGTKAGMFPLHGWLPVAHPVAPAPASAILSGIITKSGVLAIIRLVYFIFGDDFIRGTWVQQVWLGLALTTVLMGSTMALKEKVLKKRLAYSSVSQISYILVGLAMLTPSGLEGAFLHITAHAVLKVTLFICAGSIIFHTGIKETDKLAGIGKKLPMTMITFSFASLGLVGIPPFAGFISKWYIAEGALASNLDVFSWLAPIVLLVSAILTAGYLFPVCIDAFFVKPEKEIKKIKESKLMTVPFAVLVIASLMIGVFPKPLFEFFELLTNSLL